MRNTALAMLLGMVALVVFVPQYTARRLEAHRMEQLFRQSAPARIDRACPVAQDRDALLSRRLEGRALWLPACREPLPPTGVVVIEHTTRADYAQCREQLHGQSLADCHLDEPLAFLADDQPRTFARMKLADVVWVTPQPLAWGDHLVAEHRRYLLLCLFGAMLSWGMALAGRHARGTYMLVRQEGPRTVGIPVWAAFWAQYFEHPYAQSFVVDLQDDYERWLCADGKKEADALCWLHVRRSLPQLILMHFKGR